MSPFAVVVHLIHVDSDGDFLFAFGLGFSESSMKKQRHYSLFETVSVFSLLRFDNGDGVPCDAPLLRPAPGKILHKSASLPLVKAKQV